jgi:hypothetical protein
MEWNTKIIILAFAILVIALVVKRKLAKKNEKGLKDKDEDFRDINREFLDAAKSDRPIPFLRVYNHQDKMVLRSVLDSEGILTYLDLDHMSSLYPGFKVQGYTDSIIYVLERDIVTATGIAKDYIANLINVLHKNPVNKTQAAADFVSAVNFKPTSRNRVLPEFLNEENPE